MARDPFEILGEATMQEMAQSVGFDYGNLFNAAAGVAKAGVDQYQGDKAKSKAKEDSAAAVQKSLTADSAWANAEATYELSKNDATAAAAAKVMRDAAEAEAKAAGAALQGDGIAKRCKAAAEAMTAAEAAAQPAGKDQMRLRAHLHGWQKVVASCGTAPADEPEKKPSGDHAGNSFLAALTQKKAGLPVYGWGLIGMGVLGALVLVLRRRK